MILEWEESNERHEKSGNIRAQHDPSGSMRHEMTEFIGDLTMCAVVTPTILSHK